MKTTLRIVFAALGAFALWAGTEAAWAYTTPGDLFANGSPWVYPSYAAALAVGAWVGWWPRAWWAVAVAAAIAAWYCLFVPSGWWVKPPGVS